MKDEIFQEATNIILDHTEKALNGREADWYNKVWLKMSQEEKDEHNKSVDRVTDELIKHLGITTAEWDAEWDNRADMEIN